MKPCQELWKDFLSIKSFAHSLKSYGETPAVQTRHLSHQLLPTWLQMALVSERGSAGPWLSASLCSCSQLIMNRVDNLSLHFFFFYNTRFPPSAIHVLVVGVEERNVPCYILPLHWQSLQIGAVTLTSSSDLKEHKCHQKYYISINMIGK